MNTPAQPPKKKRSRMGDRLRRLGFDRSAYDRSEGIYYVRCSQCQAMTINGVPVHERGCPNEK